MIYFNIVRLFIIIWAAVMISAVESIGIRTGGMVELENTQRQELYEKVMLLAVSSFLGDAAYALKNAAEPIIKEATKNKFKIKIKQVKPVLHYVLAESGHIDIFEYSENGTRLVEQVSNVEQYIRDQVEINALYEIDNKIIIDDVIANKFTKEGQARFKPLFAPAKKIAKKLSAKFSI